MALPDWSDSSVLLGEWELEELEDDQSCKTLVQLHEDGTMTLGYTSGPPPIAERSCCSWGATATVTGMGREVSMDILLERRFPKPTANVLADPIDLPDSETYVTTRMLRGVIGDSPVPGTFALVGQIDVVTDDITGQVNLQAAGAGSDGCTAMAEDEALSGVGYFTMLKIPDPARSELPPAAGGA